MMFPRFLMTDEMALYILENFEWYRREVAFPPLPLPTNYKDLCLDFNLAAAKEAAWDFRLPEISQVVFFAMLLNDAVELDTLHGWMTEIMESALKELQFSTFKEWVRHNKGNILRAHCPKMDSDQEEGSESGDASSLSSNDDKKFYVAQAEWHFGFVTPSRGVLSFALPIPFIKMGLGPPWKAANYVRKTFKWPMRGAVRPPQLLLDNYHELYLHLDLAVAKEAARDFHIPEMIQAVSTPSCASKVCGGTCVRLDHSSTSSTFWWPQYRRRTNLGAGPGLLNGQNEDAESSDTPPPSSDDE
ncbi:hypothetical protein Cgig2_029026 [Carnegiea gigantea]|uniref:Uncharacterized protein n=1 Tax=Carnegiea gigantea TaxID=171969 RepID=A0A9Q1GVI3_9CARY|nr:hypothetical protein Cgig2_029026 [Carnegiea gigantea]